MYLLVSAKLHSPLTIARHVPKKKHASETSMKDTVITNVRGLEPGKGVVAAGVRIHQGPIRTNVMLTTEHDE